MENIASNYQFLTPNLFTTINEEEILDYLIDNDQFPKQFNRTQVISFLQNEDFYLILFIVFLDKSSLGLHRPTSEPLLSEKDKSTEEGNGRQRSGRRVEGENMGYEGYEVERREEYLELDDIV